MESTKFYLRGKFGLFIDFRSMSEDYMHGRALSSVDSKGDVNL